MHTHIAAVRFELFLRLASGLALGSGSAEQIVASGPCFGSGSVRIGFVDTGFHRTRSGGHIGFLDTGSAGNSGSFAAVVVCVRDTDFVGNSSSAGAGSAATLSLVLGSGKIGIGGNVCSRSPQTDYCSSVAQRCSVALGGSLGPNCCRRAASSCIGIRRCLQLIVLPTAQRR